MYEATLAFNMQEQKDATLEDVLKVVAGQGKTIRELTEAKKKNAGLAEFVVSPPNTCWIVGSQVAQLLSSSGTIFLVKMTIFSPCLVG